MWLRPLILGFAVLMVAILIAAMGAARESRGNDFADVAQWVGIAGLILVVVGLSGPSRRPRAEGE